LLTIETAPFFCVYPVFCAFRITTPHCGLESGFGGMGIKLEKQEVT